jgi:spore coat protein U domain-containing protein, fimbrial subunit CupE1/2/3/6
MRVSVLTSVFLVLAAAGAAAASATGSLSLQTQVTDNCQILAATLAFGTYDPVVANATQPLLAQQAIAVYCTRGTAPASIDMDNGQNANGTQRRMKNGTNHLRYNLYRNSARSHRWGTGAGSGVVPDPSAGSHIPLTSGGNAIVVYGSIPQNQNIVAGAYADVITMTVNF